MRIFEVKNNLVKIFYETSDTIFLSSFVMIKDSRETYIAQIMHLESSKHGNVAIAKIIFNLTEDGIITSYSGSIPAINSAISNIKSIDFLKLIQGQNPIIIGDFIENNLLVSVDKSVMEQKLVVCSENQENSDLMIKTLNRQIKNYGRKTVILDTDGESIFDKNTLIMSDNFKLPINSQMLNYIYEKGLEYKSAKSKAILQEAFLELQYYLSSLEESYIPVNRFIDILEKQYLKSNVPELVLLKNALIKLNDSGIFAGNVMEYKNLFESLLNNQTTVINISKIDESIQREVIFYIYSVLKEISDDFYVFVKLSNENSDKKLLKQIYTSGNIYTTVVCSYIYKYLTELKKISKNLILFSPLLQQQDFAGYNTFLSTLGKQEFVLYGQATQYMPLIIKLSERAKYSNSIPESTMSPEDARKMVQHKLKEQRQQYEAENKPNEDYNMQQQMTQDNLRNQMSQMVYPQQQIQPQMPQISYPQQPFYNAPQMFASQAYQQGYSGQIYNIPPQYNVPQIPQPMVQVPYPQPAVYNPYQQIPQPYAQQAYYQQQPIIQNTYPNQTNIPNSYQQQPFVQQPFTAQQNPVQPVQNQFNQPQQMQNINTTGQKQNNEEVPVLKSIEPQEMPIENNIKEDDKKKDDDKKIEINNQTEIINVDSNSNAITEQDLDIIQDVDDMYNNIDNQQIIENQEDYINTQEEILNKQTSDEIQLEENIKTKYNITEDSLKEPEDTVPVYPANTGNIPEINYEKGDMVSHNKFGNGKIEKIIHYGNKKLCSIYFEGIGRRLLDPTLSELKKVS